MIAIYWIFATLFSLCFGSFLNVVIYRYPKMLFAQWRLEASQYLAEPDQDSIMTPEPTPSKPFNLSFPNSHCPTCDHPIAWWHNIPIISFLCLLGRCAFCKTRISWQYPLVELATVLMTLACFWCFGWHLATIFSILLCYGLLVLTMIDLKHQLLPDIMTLGLLWLGLIYQALYHSIPLSSAIYGAILGYGILWCVGSAFKWLRNIEGMGYGDYKLLAVIGAWFGPIPVIFALLIASLSSLIIALILMACGRAQRNTPLPFGPYLALAAMIILFVQPAIITHWFYVL